MLAIISVILMISLNYTAVYFKEKLEAHHSEGLKGQFSAIKKYDIISGLLLDHVCHLLFLSE